MADGPGGQVTKRGPGRPPGRQNKTTGLLKEAILLAAEAAGDSITGTKGQGLVGYLTWLAIEEPPTFGTLLGKVLPMQVPEGSSGTLVISWQPPETE